MYRILDLIANKDSHFLYSCGSIIYDGIPHFDTINEAFSKFLFDSMPTYFAKLINSKSVLVINIHLFF